MQSQYTHVTVDTVTAETEPHTAYYSEVCVSDSKEDT